MAEDLWLKDLDAPFDDTYCPYESGKVIVGLSYIGIPKGKIVGEFKQVNGELIITLYKGPKVGGG